MPLPLTVFCFSKIRIGFTFLVLAYPGSTGQRAVKRVCGELTGLHASIKSGHVFACALRSSCTSGRMPRSDTRTQNYFVPGFGQQNWLPRQRPFRDRINIFSSFFCSHSSTNRANLAKIGGVDGEIKGLTEIVKNWNSSILQVHLRLRFSMGWLAINNDQFSSD